ncbi:hypothetical protein C7212DRAFT_345387 [Tuber magnatum]|uniref:Uncharacterized protein n=1 Tax=Tuber magnatum TaxID=42249 RepID=A0A317SLZ8_9PEZI|nr:hypothetical protein C7212DRAFT_345387 [Tuber magnatum]
MSEENLSNTPEGAGKGTDTHPPVAPYKSKTLTTAQAGFAISSPVNGNLVDSASITSTPGGAISSPMSGQSPTKHAGEMSAQGTAPGTVAAGETPGGGSNLVAQVGVFPAISPPSTSRLGRISGPYMPPRGPEAYGPSFMSGVAGIWPTDNGAELSPCMQAMKDFDAVKAGAPNSRLITGVYEASDFQKDLGNASTAQRSTAVEPEPIRAAVPAQTPASIPVADESANNPAGSPAPFESSVKSSSPGETPLRLQPESCIDELAASADSTAVEIPQGTGDRKPFGAAKPPSASDEASANAGAWGPEPMARGEAREQVAFAQYQHPIAKEINDGLGGASSTNRLLKTQEPVLPAHGDRGSWGDGVVSPGCRSHVPARQKAYTTSGPGKSSTKADSTVLTDCEEHPVPPLPNASAIRGEPVGEETCSPQDSVDNSSPQTPTDHTLDYQFPSDDQVQARARTAGTMLFSREDPNFDNLQDSDDEMPPANGAAGRKARRPTSAIPAATSLPPNGRRRRCISPEAALSTLDPAYRFLDKAALYPPCPPLNLFARKAPLPPDESQDARGMSPGLQEPKNVSIYDFIDRICSQGEDKQVAINAKSVEDFVKAYYIQGPDGSPVLNNPPTGAIPQVQIDDEWFPPSVVERYRIERVIRLLDLDISPPTRAALFWILIERQTERTRALLKFFAQYPVPNLQDVEAKLISWGYLSGGDDEDWAAPRKDVSLMDPKEVIKLDVVKETKEILDALRGASGSQKKLRFLLPFIANFDIQMALWTFLRDLKPSLFMARSTSLFDVEHLYVATHHGEVQPDILKMVASVMAPILKGASDHDGIAGRREIPEEVKKSLEQTRDLKIARYLDAQLPPVVMPTAWDLAAPRRARKQRYQEEQERLNAEKLAEHKKVMIARVEYMEDDIDHDLAVRPAEIYSPKRRDRMIQKGKARVSRPSAKYAVISGSVVPERETETPPETPTETTNVQPRLTRNRLTQAVLDEMAAPPMYRKGMTVEELSAVIVPKVPKTSTVTGKPVASSVPKEVLLSSPGARMPGGSSGQKQFPTVMRPLMRKPCSDTSSLVSVEDDSEEDRGPVKSWPRTARQGTRQSDNQGASGSSHEGGTPPTNASIAGSEKGKNAGVAIKTGKGLSHTGISRPSTARPRRLPSPVHLAVRSDPSVPGSILPDLNDGRSETDEEPPRKKLFRASNEVKRQIIGAYEGTQVSVNSQVPKATPTVAARVPSPAHIPIICQNKQTGDGEKSEGVTLPCSTGKEEACGRRMNGEEESDISDEDATPKPLPILKPKVCTPPLPPVSQPLRRSPRKHHLKRGYQSDSSPSGSDDDGATPHSPETNPNNERLKISDNSTRKGFRRNAVKTEKPRLTEKELADVTKAARGQKRKLGRVAVSKSERDTVDESEGDWSRGRPPIEAPHVQQTTVENESDISDEDETPKAASAIAERILQTPPRLSPAVAAVRRSPRKPQPMRKYKCDSSSADEDSDSDHGGDDIYAPHTSQQAKRAKLTEDAINKDSHQIAAKEQKRQRPPPPPDAETKPVTKTAPEKAATRAEAAKKAAATRAANHKALVDRITAELVAEEQRAADAGGYRPGVVTQTQIKRLVKREKERMKREAAQEKLGAAAAKREQVAEAKRIAAAQKQAAAAEKRAAGIAARRATVGEKARVPESKPESSQSTRSGRAGKASGVKTQNEKDTAKGRMAKARAELEGVNLALTAGVIADLPSSGEERSAGSEEEILEEAHSAGGSDGLESGDELELELALEISRQEEEDRAKAEAAERELEASEANNRPLAQEAQEKAGLSAAATAAAARPRKSQREEPANASTEAGEDRQVAGKRARYGQRGQPVLESQENTLKSIIDTTCPPKKRYSWMADDKPDDRERSVASEQPVAKPGYISTEMGKRRRLARNK